MPPRKLRISALVGATATGKTAVGEWLAARLGATILCADSRQLFRELSIGTGKPTRAEMLRQPHALFDLLSVGEHPAAGEYSRAAAAQALSISGSGGELLFVGGSGLYLRALIHGLSAQPPRDPALRERLGEELSHTGTPVLHERLTRLDPQRAGELQPTDTQRVIRALEIIESSGRTTAWWRAQPSTPVIEAEWRIVELTMPGPELNERVEARTAEMFATGLVEETLALIEAGREAELARLRAVGYDEAIELVHGRMSRGKAEARTSLRTRQLAKRQRTWFRHQIEAVRLSASGRTVEAVGALAIVALEHP